MPTRVLLSDLSKMTEHEYEAHLGRVVGEARDPAARHNPALEARIRAFEVRYEMTSAQLRRGLRDDTIRETAEIAEWLFYLNACDCGVSA